MAFLACAAEEDVGYRLCQWNAGHQMQSLLFGITSHISKLSRLVRSKNKKRKMSWKIMILVVVR